MAFKSLLLVLLVLICGVQLIWFKCANFLLFSHFIKQWDALLSIFFVRSFLFFMVMKTAKCHFLLLSTIYVVLVSFWYKIHTYENITYEALKIIFKVPILLINQIVMTSRIKWKMSLKEFFKIFISFWGSKERFPICLSFYTNQKWTLEF